MAMVVGTMIGSGIYLLPTTLAPFGPNLIVAFAITIAGTMCLAFAFARMAARIPGGPFAYVQSAFGETPLDTLDDRTLAHGGADLLRVALADARGESFFKFALQ